MCSGAIGRHPAQMPRYEFRAAAVSGGGKCVGERERHETVHDNEGGMTSMAARQAMQFRGQRYVYPRKPKNQSVSMQRYVACLEM